MTFLEAAIEILRSAEEPLHFSDIARLAVERKLLSHVGRDPEAAMRTCLNSAVRSKVHDGLLVRGKPGHYRLRPDADVPELPPPPSSAAPLADAEDDEPDLREKPKHSRRSRQQTSKPVEPAQLDLDVDDEADDEADEPEVAADDDDENDDETEEGEARREPVRASPEPTLDPNKVRFRGPEGSGLEGETDIALVMANAMSRLVEERPDLREELEAMQKTQPTSLQMGPEVIEVGRKKRRDDDHPARNNNHDDDRGGRRRRRRRRKGRRVEWSEASPARAEHTRGEELLDRVAALLGEAGSRSLHVRQIAEHLAQQNVLGGEISEIERAVTAALLLDVHRRQEGSRFAVRGDARYQLRGARLPEKAAAAEHAVRLAAHRLEGETEEQLYLWLQSLGARSLESLVRIWLAREGFALTATLPPSRGLGKLVVDDPEAEDEDGGRTLVLIIPRKTALDPKLWEGDAERNGCGSTLTFAMHDGADANFEGRVVSARELTTYLIRNAIGVRTLTIQAPVLDADLIESIGGLDT
jgi:hypothetical protein